MTDRVLIVGGYGAFGGRLAARLAREGAVDVIVAGRAFAKAVAFCDQHGGTPAVLDTTDPDLAAAIADLGPAIVVDASGPFQLKGEQPYRLAQAALEAGAHYLDLSDDAAFTAGVSALDADARDAGRTLISGASSVPAISSAACDALCADLDDVRLIESAILPGNRAPRGKAVMASILEQVGAPIAVWRGGAWTRSRGWTLGRRERLQVEEDKPPTTRRANLIGAPDLTLFPDRYGARSVLFRAGLELALMHDGLKVLGALNRIGLGGVVRRLLPLLKWTADRLKRFGGDRGGMVVRAVGRTKAGRFVERQWTLLAQHGDGPDIPAIPAWILIDKLRRGALSPGARPCLGEFDLAELDQALAPLHVQTQRAETEFRPVFQRIVGDEAWARLPTQLTDLHGVADLRRWRGEARVERGRGWLSRLAGALAGFPPAMEACVVEVVMERTPSGETWTRNFAGREFRSYLREQPQHDGVVQERFGVISFDIDLKVQDGKLHFPVSRGRVLGLPIPRRLLPVSTSFESVDDEGRASFDVSVDLPLAGRVVRYQGWLSPQ